MHTSKDDYLINTLRFVSAKEKTQIYGVILPESLTSPEMKETKAYKTYLVSTEEPTGKSKRVRDLQRSLLRLQQEVLLLEKLLRCHCLRRTKKVDVTRGKGIDLLFEVALVNDAQFEEVRMKSMRDFHKTHPSGSGTVTKTAPSASKIKPSVTNEGTSVKPRVPDVIEDESSERSDQERDSGDDKAQYDSEKELDSEHETDENESGSKSDHDENEDDIKDDEDEVKDEFVKTPSNDSDDEDETKITIKLKVMKMKRWIILPVSYTMMWI
ncbi:hypothetical protein Tco_1386346 [Tanacetum coccineum]